ncbi:hypothetical protein IEQ34_003759 [Dendrobium chrysotoxum]|uniref:Uncharacterized protein n=1 Tax=Dendrobium chrysotoxum TaxID=161865 RepID=A0AAV7HD34_DENCH|nr:hypothetical protein IEQ34_003759 [Dendrobium chrysotoxum]
MPKGAKSEHRNPILALKLGNGIREKNLLRNRNRGMEFRFLLKPDNEVSVSIKIRNRMMKFRGGPLTSQRLPPHLAGVTPTRATEHTCNVGVETTVPFRVCHIKRPSSGEQRHEISHRSEQPSNQKRHRKSLLWVINLTSQRARIIPKIQVPKERVKK